MPDVSPKACLSPICPGLAELGQRFCIEHRKIEYRKLDGRQPTSAERKFHNKWKEFAQAFLAKQENDLCAGCREQGKDRKATEAYYKMRDTYSPDGSLREENCVPLCSDCRKRWEVHFR
jgi:hypothetical protein